MKIAMCMFISLIFYHTSALSDTLKATRFSEAQNFVLSCRQKDNEITQFQIAYCQVVIQVRLDEYTREKTLYIYQKYKILPQKIRSEYSGDLRSDIYKVINSDIFNEKNFLKMISINKNMNTSKDVIDHIVEKYLYKD